MQLSLNLVKAAGLFTVILMGSDVVGIVICKNRVIIHAHNVLPATTLQCYKTSFHFQDFS